MVMNSVRQSTRRRVPKEPGDREHKNIPLDPIEGFLVLDVVNEEIVCIEVLYRDDLRARLLRLFP